MQNSVRDHCDNSVTWREKFIDNRRPYIRLVFPFNRTEIAQQTLILDKAKHQSVHAALAKVILTSHTLRLPRQSSFYHFARNSFNLNQNVQRISESNSGEGIGCLINQKQWTETFCETPQSWILEIGSNCLFLTLNWIVTKHESVDSWRMKWNSRRIRDNLQWQRGHSPKHAMNTKMIQKIIK
jgi:hypothetical protein